LKLRKISIRRPVSHGRCAVHSNIAGILNTIGPPKDEIKDAAERDRQR